MVHATLVFLRDNDQILLAMKKRGHGVGKWNGSGGKLEPGETPLQAAIRECEEEVGVTPTNLELVGEIRFLDLPNVDHYGHIYVGTTWNGQPSETEEMRPEWFNITDIPYDTMWPDDDLWLPLLLAGKKFKGEITVENDIIKDYHITETDSL